MNDSPIINKQMLDFVNNVKGFTKEQDKYLKERYKDSIKTSLLMKVYNRVLNNFQYIIKYYPTLSIIPIPEKTMNHENMEIDICNHIVGVHSYNMLLLTPYERGKKQSDEKYINELTLQVLKQIKIRFLGSMQFRNNKNIYLYKENYLYYPPVYYCYSLTMYLLSILNKNKLNLNKKESYSLYIISLILKRITGIMGLIEYDNLENAYAVSRGCIELYMTLIVLTYTDVDYSVYDEFNNYKIEYNSFNKLPDKFLEKYQQKKNVDKIDYLNYGWLDGIFEFGYLFKKPLYKFYEIADLVNMLYKKKFLIDGYGDYLKFYYNKCHIYTHGNIITLKYPIIYIMDLCEMVSKILFGCVNIIKEHFEIEPYEEEDIIELTIKYTENLHRLRENLDTDKLESYYKELYNK